MATTNAVEDIVAEFIDDLIFEVAIEVGNLVIRLPLNLISSPFLICLCR